MSSDLENYCRLFILGGKGCSAEDFRSAFEQYGTIKDLWIVRNRSTNEEKGVVYITFDKPSEAALAMEEMNGKCVPNNPRPLKVLIASSRKDGATREVNEDEKMLRLFVKIPQSYEEEDVREKFKEYGDVEYIRILRDRESRKSKGLAFVKYFRPYHAALALENCDASFRAVFASNKPKDRDDSKRSSHASNYEHDTGRSYGGASSGSRYDMGSYSGAYGGGYGSSSGDYSNPGSSAVTDMMHNYRNDGVMELEVLASGELSQEQLYRLFDLVPGLEYCDFDRTTGIARVKYTSAQCAAYARDKLDSFEYPTGYRVSVRYPLYPNQQSQLGRAGEGSHEIARSLQEMARTAQSIESGHVEGNLQTLVDTIKKATAVLEQKGLMSGGTDVSGNRRVHVRYCNVPLPETKPLASRDSICAERLFIVSQPDSFPENLLQDCFCRFGNLIDVYFMPGKNYGYAKYKELESAQNAIEVLHGQKVCGMRLKVMHADPPKYEREDGDESAKRQRV